MTPIVVLGLAYVAREALRLGPRARRVFGGLVLAEPRCYLALWGWWAFSAAWTRDPNAVLGSRYGLEHIRGLWEAAVPLGLVLAAGCSGARRCSGGRSAGPTSAALTSAGLTQVVGAPPAPTTAASAE